MQLETINRAVLLWTNERDTVLSPFAGIGSELYESVLMNRKALGFEIKPEYFKEACQNIKIAEHEAAKVDLFDLLEVKEELKQTV